MSPGKARRLVAMGLVVAAGAIVGCGEGKRTLRVFAADALSASFREMEHVYEATHPDTDVVLDIHGSILLTRLTPLRRGDVLAVADHRLIEKILSPKHATWVAKFATTEIVLAGHRSSKYRAEITPENWFDILLRPDVSYGIADPSQDPCGYYTRLVWELAEKHYPTTRGKSRPLARELEKNCPKPNIARDALSLISEHLNLARVDYAFVYRVHAIDQKLPFTPLPREINLGDPALADRYAKVQALVPNYRGGTETMTGSLIAFGITIPTDAPNPEDARKFVRFVLSPQGRKILERSGFKPLAPALVPAWGAVPEFLKDLAKAEE